MKTSISLFIFVFLFLNTFAQQNSNEFSLLFYNVENLFDIKNDSLKNDDEYTPEGERHWTNKRLNKKLLNTSKVILSASGWNAPAIIALCEIENRYVLERLRKDTPLNSHSYRIIHKESPDFRGIDVALLYDTEQFYPLEYECYPLTDKNGKIRNSREILYVSGIIGEKDTLHIFVNHWPSRYSGVMETRELRNGAAHQLREKVDALFDANVNAKIVVLGDFNDQPKDESMQRYLRANANSSNVLSSELYNLSWAWEELDYGTLKYQSQWYIFDQIIVSGGLLKSQEGIYTKPDWASICNLSFLYERDEKYGGDKPFRTYSGYSYKGGFSDHFPILLKLQSH